MLYDKLHLGILLILSLFGNQVVNNDIRARRDSAAATSRAARFIGGELATQELAGYHAGKGFFKVFIFMIVFVLQPECVYV